MRQNFSYISVLTQQQQLEDFDRFPRQRIHRWRSHTLKTQPFHLMTILFSFASWWYEWLTWAFCPSANWRVVQKGLNWSLCCTVRLVNGQPRALLAKIEIECPEQCSLSWSEPPRLSLSYRDCNQSVFKFAHDRSDTVRLVCKSCKKCSLCSLLQTSCSTQGFLEPKSPYVELVNCRSYFNTRPNDREI